MKNLALTFLFFIIILDSASSFAQADQRKGWNGTVKGLRTSMNVSIAKTSKIQKLDFILGENSLIVKFDNQGGYVINLIEKQIEELKASDLNKKINAGLQQAGGALANKSESQSTAPVMHVIIKGPGKSKGGANNSGAKIQASLKLAEGENDLGTSLDEGEYEMTLLIENATSGLKDTLKTQVRLGFTVEDSQLKTKHDTAKNSISNVR